MFIPGIAACQRNRCTAPRNSESREPDDITYLLNRPVFLNEIHASATVISASDLSGLNKRENVTVIQRIDRPDNHKIFVIFRYRMYKFAQQ